MSNNQFLNELQTMVDALDQARKDREEAERIERERFEDIQKFVSARLNPEDESGKMPL